MKNPTVIDVTKKSGLVETLTESQIMCSVDEKVSHLMKLFNFLFTITAKFSISKCMRDFFYEIFNSIALAFNF